MSKALLEQAFGDGVADGTSAVRHTVRQNIKYDVDLIKISATGGVLSKGDDPQASRYTLDEMKAVIAIPGDPLKDITVHQHVRFVMKSGVVYKNEAQ